MKSDKMNLPKHIAVIPDGNRRFAKQKGMVLWKGHEEGMKTAKKMLEWWVETDIQELSFWGMSTENLNRSKEEVKQLFRIFRESIKNWKKDIGELSKKHEVRVKFYGDLEKFPEDMIRSVKEIEKDTEKYNKRFLNILLGYGGKHEIVTAVNKLMKSGKKFVTEKDIQENLFVKNNADLIIRTGGMPRLSGFMPWQTVYAELYITKTLFPALTKREFLKAIKWFEEIQRNFGK